MKKDINNHKDYLGDLIGGSLMIKESKIIAQLLLNKPSQDEWNDAIVAKNILQKRSDASAKRNAATIRKRLEGCSDDYLNHISNGSNELSTQLIFAAVLINSMLLTDFLRHVVQDAKRMFREHIDAGDWASFWEERIRLFPELGRMSETSTYKISQVAFKVLAEVGYIESTRSKKLQNVYLLPETRNLLIAINREDIISAMEY